MLIKTYKKWKNRKLRMIELQETLDSNTTLQGRGTIPITAWRLGMVTTTSCKIHKKCDGEKSLSEIAEELNIPEDQVYTSVKRLIDGKMLK